MPYFDQIARALLPDRPVHREKRCETCRSATIDRLFGKESFIQSIIKNNTDMKYEVKRLKRFSYIDEEDE